MIVEHEGKSYELKMTRAGIRAAETAGFTTTMMQEQLYSAAALLFFASLFSAYKINPNKAAQMLDDLLDAGEVTFEDIYADLITQYTELFGSGESSK